MQRRRGRMLAQGLGLAAAFGVLIALPQTAAEGVRSGLTLCGQVILPSLFPFFVCSNLFVLLGFSARVSARVGGLAARLLRLPPNAGSAFVIGMTGGYPAGAQAVGLLYERGELSRDEAEHALAVCNQAGPSFIFGFLGGAVFAHPGAGALLCGVQLAAAVLTCRLTAKPLTAAQRAHSAPQRQAQPDFAAAFSEAVRRAGMSAIHVCMFVTVFSVLSGYLRLRGHIFRRTPRRWRWARWNYRPDARRCGRVRSRRSGSCASPRFCCRSAGSAFSRRAGPPRRTRSWRGGSCRAARCCRGPSPPR